MEEQKTFLEEQSKVDPKDAKRRRKEAAAEKKAKRAEAKRLEKEEEEKARIEEKKRDLIYKDTVALQKRSQKEPKIAPEGSFISLQHINKIYGNHVQAVFDFNLEIAKNEFVVLVGPSGCGKSTTLRMVAGLENITSGDLYIDGVYANDLEPKDRNLAMVFQNYALYPHMSVYSNMAYGLKMRKLPKEEIDRRVHAAAKTLELEDYLDRKPGELSGGQCQRVALGRAIVRETGVFLMDEPLSNLDAKLRVQMRSEIVALHESIGATTIYVTHDQTEAMTMADRIVVMKSGYIQQIGTPKEVYNYPSNVFVATFIGSPAMNIVDIEYDHGVIVFENGFALKLSARFIKAHDEFYVKRKAELEEQAGRLKQELEKEDLSPSMREIDERDLNHLLSTISSFEEIIASGKHKMKFGIRPEDVHEAGANSDAVHLSKALTLNVFSAEFLGKEYFVHADIGKARLIAKVNAKREISSHENIDLCLDLDRMHLFDAITSDRIPVKE